MRPRPLIPDDPFGIGAEAPAARRPAPARKLPPMPGAGSHYVELSKQLFGPRAAAESSTGNALAAGGIVCGIDPGISGALAFLQGPHVVECWDMPTLARSAAKSSTKQEVNAAAVAALLRRMKPACAYVERVNAMPNTATKQGMGAASAFNFGDSFGRLLGVLAALEIPYELVHPVSWKRRAGIPSGSDKDFSRTLAQQLFPGAELALKKHVGRAEAMLIAHYGRQG